jgi:hypothetical protein
MNDFLFEKILCKNVHGSYGDITDAIPSIVGVKAMQL